MIESVLELSENELRGLEHMHESAYYLLLWLAWSAHDLLNILFWAGIGGVLVNLIGLGITGRLLWTSWTATFVGPLVGAIIGRGRRNYMTIMALYDYDNAVAGLGGIRAVDHKSFITSSNEYATIPMPLFRRTASKKSNCSGELLGTNQAGALSLKNQRSCRPRFGSFSTGEETGGIRSTSQFIKWKPFAFSASAIGPAGPSMRMNSRN